MACLVYCWYLLLMHHWPRKALSIFVMILCIFSHWTIRDRVVTRSIFSPLVQVFEPQIPVSDPKSTFKTDVDPWSLKSCIAWFPMSRKSVDTHFQALDSHRTSLELELLPCYNPDMKKKVTCYWNKIDSALAVLIKLIVVLLHGTIFNSKYNRTNLSV